MPDENDLVVHAPHRSVEFNDVMPWYARVGVNGLIFHNPRYCSSNWSSANTDILCLSEDDHDIEDSPVNEEASV